MSAKTNTNNNNTKQRAEQAMTRCIYHRVIVEMTVGDDSDLDNLSTHELQRVPFFKGGRTFIRYNKRNFEISAKHDLTDAIDGYLTTIFRIGAPAVNASGNYNSRAVSNTKATKATTKKESNTMPATTIKESNNHKTSHVFTASETSVLECTAVNFDHATHGNDVLHLENIRAIELRLGNNSSVLERQAALKLMDDLNRLIATMDTAELQRRCDAASEKPLTAMYDLSEGCLAYFLDCADDAGNWSGKPLVDIRDAANKGHLTHLKKLGLVETWTDERDMFMTFLDSGKQLAAEHDIEVDDAGYGF